MNAVPDNGWDAVAKFDRAIAGTQGHSRTHPITSEYTKSSEMLGSMASLGRAEPIALTSASSPTVSARQWSGP